MSKTGAQCEHQEWIMEGDARDLEAPWSASALKTPQSDMCPHFSHTNTILPTLARTCVSASDSVSSLSSDCEALPGSLTGVPSAFRGICKDEGINLRG